jgi:hypothetical protein
MVVKSSLMCDGRSIVQFSVLPGVLFLLIFVAGSGTPAVK